MPLLEPTDFECVTCGWKGVVHSSPVHCRCGTKSRADGTIIQQRSILLRPGDAIAAGTQAIGFGKGCGGCNQRRQLLNAVAAKVTNQLTGGGSDG